MTEIIPILFTNNYKYVILIKQKLILPKNEGYLSLFLSFFFSLIGYFKALNLSFYNIIKDLQFLLYFFANN